MKTYRIILNTADTESRPYTKTMSYIDEKEALKSYDDLVKDYRDNAPPYIASQFGISLEEVTVLKSE